MTSRGEVPWGGGCPKFTNHVPIQVVQRYLSVLVLQMQTLKVFSKIFPQVNLKELWEEGDQEGDTAKQPLL